MFSSGGNKSYVTKILSKEGALVFVRVQADELGICLVIIERERKGKRSAEKQSWPPAAVAGKEMEVLGRILWHSGLGCSLQLDNCSHCSHWVLDIQETGKCCQS